VSEAETQPPGARTPRERSCSRSSEQRDERAAGAHSIISSAMESTPGGTSMPSACAVCKFRTNSNLVGCSTGRSAGFAPLRMRPHRRRLGDMHRQDRSHSSSGRQPPQIRENGTSLVQRGAPPRPQACRGVCRRTDWPLPQAHRCEPAQQFRMPPRSDRARASTYRKPASGPWREYIICPVKLQTRAFCCPGER